MSCPTAALPRAAAAAAAAVRRPAAARAARTCGGPTPASKLLVAGASGFVGGVSVEWKSAARRKQSAAGVGDSKGFVVRQKRHEVGPAMPLYFTCNLEQRCMRNRRHTSKLKRPRGRGCSTLARGWVLMQRVRQAAPDGHRQRQACTRTLLLPFPSSGGGGGGGGRCSRGRGRGRCRGHLHERRRRGLTLSVS